MKTSRIACVLLALAGTLCAQSPPPVMEWTTLTGQTYFARFVRMSGDHIVIERDGEEIDLSASLLKEESARQARRLAGIDEPPRLADPIGERPEMQFVKVPSNSFEMGSPHDEPGRDQGETRRRVYLKSALLMKATEVTWKEWTWVRSQAVNMNYNDLSPGANGQGGDPNGNHPVLGITWWDAIKWCNLLSQIEGRTPVYYTAPACKPTFVLTTGKPPVFVAWSVNGYRLPTEAEWEFACRSSSSRLPFHTGQIRHLGISPPDPSMKDAGWFGGNSGGTTHPVAQKKANRLELFDMHGNAAEWCWDIAGPIPAADAVEPKGAASGEARIHRGGCWSDPASACRASARAAQHPARLPNPYIGFRPVRLDADR